MRAWPVLAWARIGLVCAFARLGACLTSIGSSSARREMLGPNTRLGEAFYIAPRFGDISGKKNNQILRKKLTFLK